MARFLSAAMVLAARSWCGPVDWSSRYRVSRRTEPVQRLDGPLAADEPGQAGRAGAGGGQAGDAERGDV